MPAPKASKSKPAAKNTKPAAAKRSQPAPSHGHHAHHAAHKKPAAHKHSTETPGGDIKRTESDMGDGWKHGLKPLQPIDVRKTKSFDQMLRAMAQTSFGGRNLGEAADVVYDMVMDPDCKVVMTLSGAMTIAKQGLLIAEMIEQGMVDAVVSTGALMCHGLSEQTGHTHFRHDPSWTDDELYDAGYNRVYDTLELEASLDDLALIIRDILKGYHPKHPVGSHDINREIGRHLAKKPGRAVLKAAYQKNVPVYVPAFSDSELGLDLYMHNVLAKDEGHQPIQLDPLKEVGDWLDFCMKAKRLGIFTIGGGVPRNWAQQVGPLGELLNRRSKGKLGGLIRFHYACRICPEPTHWGGLSGCTYSEGVSWGKFVPEAEGGKFAEVYADATIAWPILVRGVLERMGRV